jgi:preprotein translocase subunit YajC
MLPRRPKEATYVFWFLAQEQQTGGSLITLLLPVAMIVGLYVILIRPQRQRQRQQQTMQSSLRVGDDVLITGGIFGVLTDLDEDAGTVRVEIAPGTEVRLLRQGVLQRLTEDEPYEEPESYDEGTDDRS